MPPYKPILFHSHGKMKSFRKIKTLWAIFFKGKLGKHLGLIMEHYANVLKASIYQSAWV